MSKKGSSQTRTKAFDRQGQEGAGEHDDVLERLRAFYSDVLRPRLRLYATSLGALVVLICLVVAVRAHSRARTERGWAELDAAEDAAALELVASEYRGTKIGAAACFQLGAVAYGEGDFEVAETRFSEFRKQYATDLRATRARLGEAYALEGQGKMSEARGAFLGIVGSVVAPEAKAEAHCGVARCLLAEGNVEEAEKSYNDAIAAADKGFYKDQATNALKAMKLRNATPATGDATGSLEPATPVVTEEPAGGGGESETETPDQGVDEKPDEGTGAEPPVAEPGPQKNETPPATE